MPLPAGLDTVTVTATRMRPDGTNPVGIITFTPAPAVLISGAEDLFIGGPHTMTFDGAGGEESVELLATDSDDVLPTGWTYTVRERFNDAPVREYSIELPKASPTVDLADLAPVEPWEPSGGGGGGGAVDSVDGRTGVVVLSDLYDALGAAAAAQAASQPLDSDLTAIAALSTTAFGRALLTLADTAALTTAANAQPLDADLTAIAALTTTAFGRGFLDLADAAAGRTKLALGTAATQNTGAFDAAGSAAAAQAASQPLDSDLTAIAALTTTAYGRAFLALADAAAGRTALGVPDAFSEVYNALTDGVSTMARQFATTNTLGSTLSSGGQRLAYFTSLKSFTSSQVRVASGNTAAGATPSLARIGLYTIDGAGAGTLVASTANDTSLFATINTVYTKSWSTPYALVAGQRYAVALLVVTAAAAPTIMGASLSTGAAPASTEYAMAPRITASRSGRTDLDASFNDSDLAAYLSRFYAAVIA